MALNEPFMRPNEPSMTLDGDHGLGSRLEIPKEPAEIDLRLLCAELEASVWAEGVSSAMGTKVKGSSQLNRRGGTHQTGDTWKPLIWCAPEEPEEATSRQWPCQRPDDSERALSCYMRVA